MAPLGWGSQGQGLAHLVITYLSLFQKHVGAQEKISPVSQSLLDSPLSVPAEPGPPTPTRDEPGREGRAGSTSEDLCPRVQHQWGSQPARGQGEATLARGNAEVLTGPWNCPHPIHGCEPEADNESDCGPGDSAGSWHLFSGSSAYSGPAKDRERELTDKGG